MSPSQPPSPVHPRDIDSTGRDMAEIQRPSMLPISSFLGQPERHHPHGYHQHQQRHSHGSSNSSQGVHQHSHNVLPPLRTDSRAPSFQDRPSGQAVPIAKLLSDVPCAPARSRPQEPSTQHSREHSYSQTAFTMRHDPPPAPFQSFSPINYRERPTHQDKAFQQPFGPAPNAGYPNPVSPTTSKSPSSASLDSGMSPREVKVASSSRTPSFATASHNSEYTLSVRQQPIAARACGFGERDRRVVDPPPILELALKDRETGQWDVDATPYVYTTLHCTLINAVSRQDESQIEPHRPDLPATQRLMGTSVASPFSGRDEFGRRGTFFVFPDLSCRSPGLYRFRFRLLIVDPLNLSIGSTSKIQSFIDSEPFEVFTAKEFPGMRASSPLLKALRRQGLNVAVKKGREATKKSSRKTQADDEDRSSDDGDIQDEDEEEAGSDDERGPVAGGSTDKPNKRKRRVDRPEIRPRY